MLNDAIMFRAAPTLSLTATTVVKLVQDNGAFSISQLYVPLGVVVAAAISFFALFKTTRLNLGHQARALDKTLQTQRDIARDDRLFEQRYPSYQTLLQVSSRLSIRAQVIFSKSIHPAFSAGPQGYENEMDAFWKDYTKWIAAWKTSAPVAGKALYEAGSALNNQARELSDMFENSTTMKPKRLAHLARDLTNQQLVLDQTIRAELQSLKP